MGMIICSKHGLTGIYSNIDETILKLIKNRKIMKEKEIIIIDVIFKDDEGEDKYDWTVHYYIDINKFYNLNLNKVYLLYSDNDYKKLIDILPKTFPCCIKCFDEFIDINKVKIKR